MKKYVVSGERWNFGRKLLFPGVSFQKKLEKELVEKLGSIFGEGVVLFVPERRLREGLARLVAGKPSVVSLERFYVDTSWHLEISRAVDINLSDIGLKPRAGADSIDRQIAELAAKGLKEIVIADDVLFSGGVLEVIRKIQNKGIGVKEFICGISIGEGMEKLSDGGLKVSSVLHCEEVIDEICHRDFYAGVPYSGRMVINGKNENIGAPYFFPFGKPVEWASIPKERAEEFSMFCLRQSIMLWEYLEKRGGKSIPCSQVGRLPLGAPKDGTRFVEFLKSLL